MSTRCFPKLCLAPSLIEAGIAVAPAGSDEVLESLKLRDERREHERVKLPIAHEHERVMFVDRLGVGVAVPRAETTGGRS